MTQTSPGGSRSVPRVSSLLAPGWAGVVQLAALALLFSACGPADPTADEDGDGLAVLEDCDDSDPAIGSRYADLDGDGYGSGDPLAGCDDLSATGFSAFGGDCDEDNPAAYPTAVEACDGADSDCDGAIDEDDTRTWHRDADGDGYGDPDSIRQECAQPANYVADGTDCDDSRATVHPDATELCDFLDNDCDEQEDEGLETSEFYADRDEDGFGDPDMTTEACAAPDGYVDNDSDCDDEDMALNPLEPEACDGIDNDCNGEIDDSADFDYFRDLDQDGYGSGEAVTSCVGAPPGYAAEGGDCNEADPATSPGAVEQCDDKDNDCDLDTDEERVDQTFYRDADGDGYGTTAQTKVDCSRPSGYVSDDQDCNDSRADIHPGATEVRGDGVDSNCNGYKDVIEALAGSGAPGYEGDDGPASSAALWSPSSLAVDSHGHLYIADTSNHRIRKVDAATGLITTFAGNGTTVGTRGGIGDDGPATEGMLERPYGVAVDALDNLYIADTYHHRIRKVDNRSGLITTVAGSGRADFYGDGGPATDARLNYPGGVAIDPDGAILIADTDNNRIRRVAYDGTISTVAGTGEEGYGGDGLQATAAMLALPYSVVVDAEGNLFIADTYNSRIRKVAEDGRIFTVAGGKLTSDGEGGMAPHGYSGDGGAATGAQLNFPTGLEVLSDGSFYIADTDNHVIRWVGVDGRITTVAGTGTLGDAGDGGLALEAQLFGPASVAADLWGDLFIADSHNNRVRTVYW